MSICTNCGFELAETARFCKRCGTPAPVAAPVPAAPAVPAEPAKPALSPEETAVELDSLASQLKELAGNMLSTYTDGMNTLKQTLEEKEAAFNEGISSKDAELAECKTALEDMTAQKSAMVSACAAVSAEKNALEAQLAECKAALAEKDAAYAELSARLDAANARCAELEASVASFSSAAAAAVAAPVAEEPSAQEVPDFDVTLAGDFAPPAETPASTGFSAPAFTVPAAPVIENYVSPLTLDPVFPSSPAAEAPAEEPAAPAQPAARPAPAFCPECGNKLNGGELFCGACGFKLR